MTKSTDGEDNTETLGNLFRNARLARQLSIEDASEATRIHTPIIRGIEDDNYTQMPAEVFVRGFIKLYSEFLELDPEETLSRYAYQENSDPDKGNETPSLQHVFTDETYANLPVYKKSTRKVSIITISILLLIGIFVIGSLLPEITDITSTVQTSDRIELTQADSSDRPVQESVQSDEPEILIDRPPAITVEEEVITENPATSSGSSEPEENTRVLENKLFKITKKKDDSVNSTTSDTSEDTDTSHQTTEEAELPSPESPIEKILGYRDSETTEDTLAEIILSEPDLEPSQVEAEESRDAYKISPVKEVEKHAIIAQKEILPAITVNNSIEADTVEAALEQVAENDTELPAEEVLSTVVSPEEQPQQFELTSVPQIVSLAVSDSGNETSPGEKPVTVKLLTAEPATDTKPEAEVSPPPAPAAKYLLSARFVESTWMRIKVDGKKPRQYTYKPGMTRTWKADRSIDLHLGNGGGVELSLNGKPLPTGAPSGKVAKIRIPDDIP